MLVTGQVLDPRGKPIPNAAVAVYGQLKRLVADDPLEKRYSTSVLGQARSDGSGRFQLNAVRLGRRGMNSSGRSRRRRAMVSTGSPLIRTPSNPMPISRYSPSR